MSVAPRTVLVGHDLGCGAACDDSPWIEASNALRWYVWRRHLSGDRPDEARQLARDRSRHHRQRLAGEGELAIAPAQPLLRLPRRVANRFRQGFLAQQLVAADPGREAVAPG